MMPPACDWDLIQVFRLHVPDHSFDRLVVAVLEEIERAPDADFLQASLGRSSHVGMNVCRMIRPVS